jgi:ferric iron reductase protein FhuF
MTQHLWLAWGSRFQNHCHNAPAWDYKKTTEEISHRLIWQGTGAKCKRCLKEARKVGDELSMAGVEE